LKLVGVFIGLLRFIFDVQKGTWSAAAIPIGFIQGLIAQLTSKAGQQPALPLAVAELLVGHRFDLLGSGWSCVYRNMHYRGRKSHLDYLLQPIVMRHEGQWLSQMLNRSNILQSRRIWRLVDSDYIPIDWQLDFKSGYRWSERTWYKNIRYGHKLGVDVKVPWELARMQHLPQLALAFWADATQVALSREFRNQVLDFIATNPPRFGVNWACTMDVAIRAANWLVAYDLFCAGNHSFDREFMIVFSRSIYEHGCHIINNLEWNRGHRGNHYLADIAGLAFISAHQPANSLSDAWLAFAIQELIQEVEHQFYPDGTGFEGSTAYHRLSAEMVYFTTALILGLPKERIARLKSYDHRECKTQWGGPKLRPAPLSFYPIPGNCSSIIRESPFPGWYFERLEKMAEFIVDITKPDGTMPQIGDNDSGRLFKLAPKYHCMTVAKAQELYENLSDYSDLPGDAEYDVEDHLDCKHLMAAAYGLFGRDDFAKWLGGVEAAETHPDCVVIKGLSGGAQIASRHLGAGGVAVELCLPLGKEQAFQNRCRELGCSTEQIKMPIEFKGNIGRPNERGLIAYPDFGLYIFKSPGFYLAVRCWSGLKPYVTGHMHYDQLGIELVLNGENLISDPGSYVYTSFPELRNKYRGAEAHFMPRIKEFDYSLNDKRLFTLKAQEIAEVLYFGQNGFWGKKYGGGGEAELICQLLDDRLLVYGIEKDLVERYPTVPFSPGYGMRLRHSSLNPIQRNAKRVL